jgi:uncharacterized integral membrane protein
MLNFSAKHFRSVFDISLWLNLIFCAVWGAILGKESSIGFAFLGFILGFVVGLLSNVIFGGLIAVFLNIAEDVKLLRDRIERMESSNTTSKGSSSTTSKDTIGLTSSNKTSGDPLGLV